MSNNAFSPEDKNQELLEATSSNDGFLTFLIQSLVSMANDSTNKKFFFPIFLQGITLDGGQKLVPFVTTLNLGKVPELQPDASQFICQSGWAGFNHYGGGAAAIAAPTFNITSATFNGLNNAKITSYRLDPPTAGLQYPVVFTASLNAYSSYSNLGINPGAFFLDVLCQTNDKQHEQDLSAHGTFQGAFTEPMFTLVLYMTFNSDLTVTIEIPESYTPTIGGSAMPGLQISFGSGGGLSVNNIVITDGGDLSSYYSMFANRAFAQSDAAEQIIALFNKNILASSIRTAVASAIQNQFNSLISDLK